MSEYIAVNRSGVNVSVYSDDTLTNYIGYLAPNEIYGIIGFSEGPSTAVIFRNNGVKTNGYISAGTSNITPISDIPYGSITAWDYLANAYAQHDTYYMNRSATIYDAGGSVWGSVAAGQQVAAKGSYGGQNGSNNPDWLQINYVRSTSGSWVAINNAFGFVPIGLEYGSSPSTANLKGGY